MDTFEPKTTNAINHVELMPTLPKPESVLASMATPETCKESVCPREAAPNAEPMKYQALLEDVLATLVFTEQIKTHAYQFVQVPTNIGQAPHVHVVMDMLRVPMDSVYPQSSTADSLK